RSVRSPYRGSDGRAGAGVAYVVGRGPDEHSSGVGLLLDLQPRTGPGPGEQRFGLVQPGARAFGCHLIGVPDSRGAPEGPCAAFEPWRFRMGPPDYIQGLR